MALDEGVVELLEDFRGSLHRWLSRCQERTSGQPSLTSAVVDRVSPQTVDHFCDGLIALAHAASTLDEPEPEPPPDTHRPTTGRPEPTAEETPVSEQTP